MLHSLTLKNFAIVESLTLEFSSGFNVITGETGAGKSVITGAIGLLLGGRTDKNMIRAGADRADLSALFLIHQGEIELLKDLLEKMDIPFENINGTGIELNIRRTLTQTGTRNYVNDISVTAQFLSQLAELLIDVHAANEHYSLSKHSTQLLLLDRFSEGTDLLSLSKQLYAKCIEIENEKNNLMSTIPSEKEAINLKETLSEIEASELKEGEDQLIANQYTRAASAQELVSLLAQANGLLNDSEGAIGEQLIELKRVIDRLAHLDEVQGGTLQGSLEQIVDLISDFERDLVKYGRDIECDEEALFQLNERLALIQKMKRRYGPTLEDVQKTANEARIKLDAFEHAEEKLNQLANTVLLTKKAHQEVAINLHELRKVKSIELSEKVSELLNKLGFLRAHFAISFSKTELGAKGFDKVEFMFSANLGENIAPLHAIASSGEISRVMLAIKAVLADADCVPVLLFDEIDVNIGGETASIVGDELKRLSNGHQVICISHLAQVAVKAQRHIHVAKHVENGRTTTQAIVLDLTGRTQEIARMLGGGEPARLHAKLLLETIL